MEKIQAKPRKKPKTNFFKATLRKKTQQNLFSLMKNSSFKEFVCDKLYYLKPTN